MAAVLLNKRHPGCRVLAEDAPDNTTTAGAFTYNEGSGFDGSGGGDSW